MTLDEVKKIFRYGWIAKDEDETWHWFSKEPAVPFFDDDYWGYYWPCEYEIEIGFIEGTEDINSFDSLIEIKGEKNEKIF